MSKHPINGVPPESVAIVALGPSKAEYMALTAGMGDPHFLYEEIWGINAAATVLRCDLMFHMDDVRIQERRAAIDPKGTVDNMLRWMKTSDIPIMSSRAHSDYPMIQELPIEKVLTHVGMDYFNSTAAWAVGYALAIGVTKIALFGFDFTYKNHEKAERGRACVEYLIGWGRAKGVNFKLASQTTLMDLMLSKQDRLYGYDTVDLTIRGREDGSAEVLLNELPEDEWPSGEEINHRYDHTRHPNEMVRNVA
jgi:hypothetical protein